jgi:hypothetical protein
MAFPVHRQTGENNVPSKDYSEERKAILAKTSRLRELRLAKEAEDRKASSLTAEQASPPRKPRATKKKRIPAPWPW